MSSLSTSTTRCSAAAMVQWMDVSQRKTCTQLKWHRHSNFGRCLFSLHMSVLLVFLRVTGASPSTNLKYTIHTYIYIYYTIIYVRFCGFPCKGMVHDDMVVRCSSPPGCSLKQLPVSHEAVSFVAESFRTIAILARSLMVCVSLKS